MVAVFDDLIANKVSESSLPIDLTPHSALVAKIEWVYLVQRWPSADLLAEMNWSQWKPLEWWLWKGLSPATQIQNMDLEGNSTTETGAAKIRVDGTAITLHIDKIGLKDAESGGYIQPQIKVTVVGNNPGSQDDMRSQMAKASRLKSLRRHLQGQQPVWSSTCCSTKESHFEHPWKHSKMWMTAQSSSSSTTSNPTRTWCGVPVPAAELQLIQISTKCYSFMEFEEFNTNWKNACLEMWVCVSFRVIHVVAAVVRSQRTSPEPSSQSACQWRTIWTFI